MKESHTDALVLARNLRLLDDERIGRERRMALRARRWRRGYNANWWMKPMIRLVVISVWVVLIGWTWPELGMLLWQ